MRNINGRRTIEDITSQRAQQEAARASVDVENRVANLERKQIGSQMLFSGHKSTLPLVGSYTGHRRHPGGLIFINAYKFVAASGTVVANTNQNSLSNDDDAYPNGHFVVEDNQNVGTAHTGATTIEFTVGEVGLVPGVIYNMLVSWRWPAASAGFIARIWVGPGTMSTGDDWISCGGYASAKDYFGSEYCNAGIGWTSGADVVTIQVGQDNSSPNSADVEVDYVIFFPVGDIGDMTITGPTPAPPDDMWATYWRNGNGNFEGPTYSFVANADYSAFGGAVITDSQVVRGILDPDFDITISDFGLSHWDQYAATDGSFLTYQPGSVTYPRHLFASARLKDETAGSNDGTHEGEGYVTVFNNGIPTASSPIVTCSWHLIYLGCYYIDRPNNISFALWTSPLDGTDARSPNVYSSAAYRPQMDGQIIAVSSYFDQIGWKE